MNEIGIERYTCPVLFGYTEDHSDNRKEDGNMADYVKCETEQSIFEPIRDRDDFRAIFDWLPPSVLKQFLKKQNTTIRNKEHPPPR